MSNVPVIHTSCSLGTIEVSTEYHTGKSLVTRAVVSSYIYINQLV